MKLIDDMTASFEVLALKYRAGAMPRDEFLGELSRMAHQLLDELVADLVVRRRDVQQGQRLEEQLRQFLEIVDK